MAANALHLDGPSSPSQSDFIFLRNLNLSAIVGNDAWHRRKPQPVQIDIRLGIDLAPVVADDLSGSVSYSDVAKAVRAAVHGGDEEHSVKDEYGHERAVRGWSGLHFLGNQIVTNVLRLFGQEGRPNPKSMDLVITLPKAILLAEGGLSVCLSSPSTARSLVKLSVKGIRLPCIIGLNEHERVERQFVVVDLGLWERVTGYSRRLFDACESVMPRVVSRIENSQFQTLEMLAMAIVATAFEASEGFESITVSVEKPSAITDVAGSGVEITRTRSHGENFGA